MSRPSPLAQSDSSPVPMDWRERTVRTPSYVLWPLRFELLHVSAAAVVLAGNGFLAFQRPSTPRRTQLAYVMAPNSCDPSWNLRLMETLGRRYEWETMVDRLCGCCSDFCLYR